ncbi:MAG: DPP IV N-terminal domain-containing protein, partial [Pseudomonadota bacterium]
MQCTNYKNTIGFLSLLIGMAGSAALAQSTGDKTDANNHLTAMDVFDIEVARDPQISPDGKSVAYVRGSNDIMVDKTRNNIWLASTDGKDHRPIASGRSNYSSPRWSPSGDRLAFVSSTEGSPQIYVRWMDTGDTALVTNLTASPRDIAWSPDGTQIAFVMDKPLETKPLVSAKLKKPDDAAWAEPFKVIEAARFRSDGEGFYDPRRAHVFVVPADGGAPRQLTSGDFDHDGPLSWTPDGQSILFAANRHENWELETVEADLFSISLAGELTQITDQPGAETSPKVSPDGKTIAFLKSANEGKAYRLTRVSTVGIDGGAIKDVHGDFNRRAFDLNWSADGKGVYFSYDDRGARNIGFMDLDGKRRQVVGNLGGLSLGRPYLSGAYSVASDGSSAYTLAIETRPADVGFLSGTKTTRLTGL